MIRQLQNSIEVIAVKYSFIYLEYDNSFQISQIIQALELGIIQ